MTNHLMPTYARLPVAFARGEGVGCGTPRASATSMGSPVSPSAAWAMRIRVSCASCTAQAARLIHASNLYQIPEQEKLADRSARSRTWTTYSSAIRAARRTRPRSSLRAYTAIRRASTARHRGDGKSVSRAHHRDVVGDRQPQGTGRVRAAAVGIRARALR